MSLLFYPVPAAFSLAPICLTAFPNFFGPLLCSLCFFCASFTFSVIFLPQTYLYCPKVTLFNAPPTRFFFYTRVVSTVIFVTRGYQGSQSAVSAFSWTNLLLLLSSQRAPGNTEPYVRPHFFWVDEQLIYLLMSGLYIFFFFFFFPHYYLFAPFTMLRFVGLGSIPVCVDHVANHRRLIFDM